VRRNGRAIRAIIRKDLRQVLQSKSVILPMVLVPALLLVVMPVVMVLLPNWVDPADLDVEDVQGLFQAMPPSLRAAFEGLSLGQTWIMLTANYMFAPMFLIVPLMVAIIVASDSFVGEKERRTLEGLLYTPVSDADLFLAKVLTALLPAVVIDIASFVVMIVAVNAAGYSQMGRLFFPAAPWWPMVLWLGPAVSLAGMGATVLISAKTSTFMQAQQLSGVLVLPIVLLMFGQMSGVLFLGVGVILGLGLLMYLLGALLVWIGARTFSRGELMARI
jgi:ABC-2 type transport system permease protein